MVLLLQNCYHGTVAAKLLPWYRCCNAVTMVPLLYYCYHGTVAVMLLPWYCCSTTITMVLLLYHCYHGTVAVMLLPWYRCCTTVTMVLLLYYCHQSSVSILLLTHSCYHGPVCVPCGDQQQKCIPGNDKPQTSGTTFAISAQYVLSRNLTSSLRTTTGLL